MSEFHWKKSTLCALIALLSLGAGAAERQRIEREADIPRFNYGVSAPLERVVRDKALFEEVTAKVHTDIESVLAQYELADKSAERGRLGTLMQLDFLAGRYDAALASADKIRALEEKPADKLLSGIRMRAMVAAMKADLIFNSPPYMEAVAASVRKELEALPFDVIANDIRRAKAGTDFLGEGRIVGRIRDDLQPTLDKTGALSFELAQDVIYSRFVLETVLPLKNIMARVYTSYLDAHKVQKANIWAARAVDLPKTGPYHPVRVAVWDSGVDSKLFSGQLITTAKGQPEVIAFGLDSRPAKTELLPIPADVQPKLPMLLSYEKGFSDATSNIDSPESAAIKKYMSELKPEDFKTTMEQLGLVGNYAHGTHVAGITLAGNPWARLAIARISFDYKLLPDPCPSRELAQRSAASHGAVVKFLKRNKIRAVNMSWGGSVKEYEESIEKCGLGKTAQDRLALAREFFNLEKKALTQAMASAPEILFIAAAGNSNSDASFAEFIPSSIVAPNLLTVGAVDIAGDEASFTSYGPTVAVHANGYQVESYLPGGMRVALSGTSMASPNVTNLAAKLLAAKPSLKPAQVIAIIRETADTTPDGRRHLVNPAKAMARVMAGD